VPRQPALGGRGRPAGVERKQRVEKVRGRLAGTGRRKKRPVEVRHLQPEAARKGEGRRRGATDCDAGEQHEKGAAMKRAPGVVGKQNVKMLEEEPYAAEKGDNRPARRETRNGQGRPVHSEVDQRARSGRSELGRGPATLPARRGHPVLACGRR